MPVQRYTGWSIMDKEFVGVSCNKDHQKKNIPMNNHKSKKQNKTNKKTKYFFSSARQSEAPKKR